MGPESLSRCGVRFGHQGAQARDQLFAVLDRIRARVVAADQQARGAELVIFEECPGDGFRRTDEGRRIALRAGRDGKRGPQAGIVHLGFGRSLQQPLRTDILALWRRCAAAAGSNPFENGSRPIPGGTLARRQDRPRRQAETRRPAPARCLAR